MTSTPGFATLKKWHPHIQGPLVVGAPARPYTLHRLAIAVTQAGGFGFISATSNDAEELHAAAAIFAAQPVETRTCEDGGSPVLPIGIGYLCWMTGPETAVQNVAKYRVGAVWLYAWNDMEHLKTWVDRLRAKCPWAVLYIQVLNVAETLRVLEHGCSGRSDDVALVVQGTDAGGHGAAGGSASLMTVLPEVRATLAAHDYAHIPLLAAGGIVDGTGTAAALALGASGVVLGTRLLATHESAAPPGFRRHVVRATDGGIATLRTRLFDDLRGTAAFPSAYDGRALRNRSVVQHQQGVPFEVLKDRYDAANAKWNQRAATATVSETQADVNGAAEDVQDAVDETWGEHGRLTSYAGTGVGLIVDIRGAGEIVMAVREGARDRVKRMNKELDLEKAQRRGGDERKSRL